MLQHNGRPILIMRALALFGLYGSHFIMSMLVRYVSACT